MECTLSTHKAEIVPVVLEKHPNADTLSIVRVFGYTCCVRTADWEGIQLAAYLPPDSTCSALRPEFNFLLKDAKQDGVVRVKAKKLRGIISFGLLVPAPPGAKLGDDVAEQLGVGHYEPPLTQEKRSGFTGGEVGPAPNIAAYKYDLEAFRRYHTLFVPGEQVFITEKVDGANARYVYHGGQMYCGSRTEWKKEFPSYDHITVERLVAHGKTEEQAKEIIEKLNSKPAKKNLWWELLEKTPSLEAFCYDHPGIVVYGEIFGTVNCIKYGLPEGNRFAAFDLLREGRWVDAQEARDIVDGHFAWVPTVATIPYEFDSICQLAEGNSLVEGAKPGTIREGVVVKPVHERYDAHLGRVCLKVVSGEYLEKYR